MNARVPEIASALDARLPDGLRNGLATTPLSAITTEGLKVIMVGAVMSGEACSCDGAYFPPPLAPRPTISYVHTPGSRRENFTLVHEFGHHLVRQDDDLLSELADQVVDAGDDLEERICDAFAGRVLLPKATVASVLKGRRPEATDLQNLFRASSASLEACAVRLAEHLRCEGYVAILDAGARCVRFASASPESTYSWRRGTVLPPNHAAWRAISAGTYRGEGEVVWQSGSRMMMWLDAVPLRNSLVAAVFAADRYWAAEGIGILSDPSQTRPTPYLLSGTCKHCGASAYGTRACEKCGDVTCRSCGRCGCGAPQSLTKICPRCHMVKGKAQFRRGADACRECEGAAPAQGSTTVE